MAGDSENRKQGTPGKNQDRKRGKRFRKRRSKSNTRSLINRNFPLSICPFCQKPIRELFSAISCKVEPGMESPAIQVETDEEEMEQTETKMLEKPAHFDCVMKEIRQNEDIGNNERLCYLGNGSFGIITFRNPSSPIKFLIKKRIQYEDPSSAPEWRKKLPIQVR